MRSWPRRLLGIEPFQDTEEYNIDSLSNFDRAILQAYIGEYKVNIPNFSILVRKLSVKDNLDEMLSKEGKEIKDLQDMSERLRMIVSESRKAFSEVYKTPSQFLD
ncbi:hypothetical protein P8X24_07155 [Pyrococcus kukulkanii]|uniref:hypothetical protein n=1 Tax=Pyrococcus kukulkanii TaxID=1609559 RepID=UPI00356A9D2D